MKIVAFLQNPWFHATTDLRYIKMYQENQAFHRRVLAMSATGRALRKAFGDELYQGIYWDNACTCHGASPDAVFPPDLSHMSRVIAEHRPDVVLLFGRQAFTGWDMIKHAPHLEILTKDIKVLTAPHPMARGSAKQHLDKINREVKKLWTKSAAAR